MNPETDKTRPFLQRNSFKYYKIKASQQTIVMAATEVLTANFFPAPRNTCKLGDGTVVTCSCACACACSCASIVISEGIVGVTTGGTGTNADDVPVADDVLVLVVSAGT
jgi:hypothetical protein